MFLEVSLLSYLKYGSKSWFEDTKSAAMTITLTILGKLFNIIYYVFPLSNIGMTLIVPTS